ncbi:MAG: DUF3592 domain-containing protein [Clostridia bacterium]|nr:DUF3592 domain-containing protein [Clostridia bacterium]
MGAKIKRILSYVFTYLLLTIFLFVVTGSIWYMLSGGDLSDSAVECTGVIVSAGIPSVSSDTPRGTTDTYRVSYKQYVTVKYTYHGASYTNGKDIVYKTEMYDKEPNLDAIEATPKYMKDSSIVIYVSSDDPNNFEISDRFSSEGTSFWSILKWGLPVYGAVVILFTWTFIQKERAIKKQAFYDSIRR